MNKIKLIFKRAKSCPMNISVKVHNYNTCKNIICKECENELIEIYNSLGNKLAKPVSKKIEGYVDQLL